MSEAVTPQVLLVDDEAPVLRVFRRCLEAEGYRVSAAQSATEAESALGRGVFDVCVLDLDLNDESGIELLPKLREWAPWMRVVMATATDDVAVAVSAIRSGASDYLVKPCLPEQLIHTVGQQVEARMLERRIQALESDSDSTGEGDFSTRNPILSATLDLARRVADTTATLLLLGESGTGKSVLARAIHRWSSRRDAMFATVSCPSLSPDLIASELFGHVRGAFTGATDNRQGRVQIAEGGTLFLDEIGDLPLAIQPKLLRFLQGHEYERVGDPQTRTANVRVIAATNHNLETMVAEGKFREDLYYRLNVVTLKLPPLRERREEILAAADKLLLLFVRQYDRPARRFGKEAALLLSGHSWMGNLRELRNAVERAVIICEGDTIGVEHLPFGNSGPSPGNGIRTGDPVSLAELERMHIQRIVSSTPSLEAAAKLLGIDSSTLYRKRVQYEMR